MVLEKVSHKRDVMESLMKNLFHLRTQYFTDNKSIPQNVLVQLFRDVDISLDELLDICNICGPKWITSRGHEKLSVALMAAIDDAKVGPGEAGDFIEKLEQAMFPEIDLRSLLSYYFSHEGFQFGVMISENFSSSYYMQTLLKYRCDYWQIIAKQLCNQNQVCVSYYDDTLRTPADCIVLAQFLMQLQETFRIKMSGLHYITSKINRNMAMNLFPSGISWDSYLRRMIENVMSIPVKIKEGVSPSFPSMLVLQNKYFQLEIIPLAGLSSNLDLTVNGKELDWEDIKCHPMMDINCRLKDRLVMKGLPFLVSYIPSKSN